MAGEVSSLRTVLQHMLRALGLERRFKSEQIGVIWPQVVGPAIAKIAQPTQLRTGTLFIDVVDGIWMQELKLREREILGRLNEALGEALVTRMFLRLGQVVPAAAPEGAGTTRPSTGAPSMGLQEEAALEEEVASVRDPELREVLKGLRRRMLQVGGEGIAGRGEKRREFRARDKEIGQEGKDGV